MAKTVVFDFDGVIHSYTSGWLGETTIPDPPVPGIREALKEIHGAGYEVVVISTRCATAKGKGAIEAWLYNNGLREYIDKVCKEKPPAIAYIDDRAICFDGHPENLLKKIQNFEPWYKIPTLTPPNEWVSVEERLPENSERWETYIVTVNRSHWPTSSYDPCDAPYDEELVVSAQYDSKQKIWHLPWDEQLNALIQADDAPINGDFVTHWMPMPAPPKKERDHE